MRPDDPRHGRYAGYQAHVHSGDSPVLCEPCLAARRRRDKADRLRVARGIPALVDGTVALAAVQEWLHMGVSPTVLDRCVANPSGGIVVRLISGDIHAVRLSTLARLRAVAEVDLPDSARVYADLTRYRIYSLMAAGHTQRGLGINPRGHWRSRDRITIGQVRRMRDTYRRLEQQPGDNANTAARALNRGILPPAGWDDPNTLAWPRGWPQPGETPADADDEYLDEAAILRRMHGDRVPVTVAEKGEVVRRMFSAGHSWNAVEHITGLKPDRYVHREVA